MIMRSWRVDGLTVRCELQVIQRISAAAREGFMRFPHGGMEVGGLLRGDLHGTEMHIRDAEALTIEYSRGPSFRLSEADTVMLRTALAESHDVVGWYESHTRRDLTLSD